MAKKKEVKKKEGNPQATTISHCNLRQSVEFNDHAASIVTSIADACRANAEALDTAADSLRSNAQALLGVTNLLAGQKGSFPSMVTVSLGDEGGKE